jgi:hypothetical protein
MWTSIFTLCFASTLLQSEITASRGRPQLQEQVAARPTKAFEKNVIKRNDAPVKQDAPKPKRNDPDWERLSWISTTVGFLITALGLIAVVIQLSFQGRQTRLEFLNRLYGELDTHEARDVRASIYRASPEELMLDVLHAPGNEEKRRSVEDTLATFERLAYPIVHKQVPSQDAFNLYGGVLLSIAHQLWPYVEQQREMRKKSGLRHRLGYRRFLEAAIHDFAPKYVRAAGLPPLPRGLPTKELLRRLFPERNPAPNV